MASERMRTFCSSHFSLGSMPARALGVQCWLGEFNLLVFWAAACVVQHSDC